jgi:hypothetical protein
MMHCVTFNVLQLHCYVNTVKKSVSCRTAPGTAQQQCKIRLNGFLVLIFSLCDWEFKLPVRKVLINNKFYIM